MSPSKPDEGKAAEEEIEAKATEEGAATETADSEREQSKAPKAKAKALRRKKAAPAAEPTAAKQAAAEEAGDDKAVAAKPTRRSAKAATAKAETEDSQTVDAKAAEAQAPETAPKPRRTRRKAEPEKPAAPAAKTRRPSRDYGDNPPMVRAHAKYVRTSARKARLVCDHIRGKSVEEARAILAHANRDVARDWSKLLESAVANAEHNHELIGDELRIAAVKADEGPTLKRFRPRAMGRATKIRKRTSHLSITLTPKDGDN